MRHKLLLLLGDESGQDLIEYALLCTTIGFAAAAGAEFLRGAMGDTYQVWDANVQSNALVVPDFTPTPAP